jgi:hypothetical protein|tara:strand:- start:154 stop:435 length:282 start_codon:yes stop_codon:yes gene_type:complete
MKTVTITVGDYDLEIIEQIFEKESKFAPQDPRDELMIEVMRQIKDNPKVDLGADEAVDYEKAKSRFANKLVDGRLTNTATTPKEETLEKVEAA